MSFCTHIVLPSVLEPTSFDFSRKPCLSVDFRIQPQVGHSYKYPVARKDTFSALNGYYFHKGLISYTNALEYFRVLGFPE